MSDPNPLLLFVPVSGAFGMGEYARSLAIAQAAVQRWPGAHVHFVLSREAPYALGSPFPATLLPSSATLNNAAMVELIHDLKPRIVIFDNAGRTAQLQASRRAGARIIYISARARARRKAFRVRWMRLIDEHWIAYPRFIAGDLSWLERLKQRRLGRPAVRYLDVILSRPATTEDAGARGNFVLMVPGGGTGHPRAQHACAEFLRASEALAAAGLAVRYVGPPAPGERAAGGLRRAAAGPEVAPAGLELMGALPQSALALLMRRARLVVANGGSTLLQAIACGAACVAVPIAADQRLRTRRCVAAGAVVASRLAARDIESHTLRLLRDAAARSALERRVRALSLADGIEVALRALAPYLQPA